MTNFTLSDLGWSDQFARQIGEDTKDLHPARIYEVQRDLLLVLTEDGQKSLIPTESAGEYAVGDWVLNDGVKALHRLEPFSNLTRKAAGHVSYQQRIAANIDTIAIVTSCNADFNVPRLERYLAMVSSAGAMPLVLLTKADRVEDARDYQRQAERISPLVTAIALNATDVEDVAQLIPWCRGGQTLALIGSSGVGKTTLRNSLTGENAITQDIREDDARGRHTTTHRSLVPTPYGGWLIDTPGMRELQLAGMEDGISAVFDDIEQLAIQCKFNNCDHESEPGCAVRTAIEAGELETDRLERWRKLLREDAINTESVARQRARGKAFSKMVKKTMTGAKKRKGR
ncbi:ribosome small subunit-dependent GTPase A [Pelagimonas varians]|uniref:Small ribosomal subunit biogenesis GTPase RsgA n=1 Tax=Pelagimonas varians TaxID=696760 RepID=A0A238KDC4_9RHOB|nr:ribosome small subunit-dependent GTPase A [Pelagimonas varians]PYG29890.1 ribosome biogenesis GTPase [Pelagimonas varians]SMX40851.1 Putative ribosome biogenesis GTPase RsgA [Pelagimonas varians]